MATEDGLVLGVDVARYGTERTMLAAICEGQVMASYEMPPGSDLSAIWRRIDVMARGLRAKKVVVKSSVLGSALVDLLRQNLIWPPPLIEEEVVEPLPHTAG